MSILSTSIPCVLFVFLVVCSASHGVPQLEKKKHKPLKPGDINKPTYSSLSNTARSLQYVLPHTVSAPSLDNSDASVAHRNPGSAYSSLRKEQNQRSPVYDFPTLTQSFPQPCSFIRSSAVLRHRVPQLRDIEQSRKPGDSLVTGQRAGGQVGNNPVRSGGEVRASRDSIAHRSRSRGVLQRYVGYATGSYLGGARDLRAGILQQGLPQPDPPLLRCEREVSRSPRNYNCCWCCCLLPQLLIAMI